VQGARREEEPHAQEERGENSRAHRNSRQPRANLQAGAKIQRQKNPRLGVAQTPTTPRRTPYSIFPGRRGRLATIDA
jgi:hypothetical protein